MFQSLIALLLFALLALLLYHNWQVAIAKQRSMPEQVLGPLRSILENVEIRQGEAVGVYQLMGSYQGEPVAVKAIVDLLMVRKLPSLWLMVTLPSDIKVPGTLDIMLRPAGQTSFSKFDFLPITLTRPASFPETAIVRADTARMQSYLDILPLEKFFYIPRLKEVLITSKGLRIVTLLAEGDRVRYGVFRQAEFGNAVADALSVNQQLDLLIDMKKIIFA